MTTDIVAACMPIGAVIMTTPTPSKVVAAMKDDSVKLHFKYNTSRITILILNYMTAKTRHVTSHRLLPRLIYKSDHLTVSIDYDKTL